MTLDLFGQPIRRTAAFQVFHDESEPNANKGWLLIGLLFVDQRKAPQIQEILRHWRDKEEYLGEIHFCDLPKSFRGKYSAKARVAKGWMEAYQGGLYQDAMFTCLAVNRASPKFEHNRFTHDFHAYNRFTAMAIKAGISYLLAPLGYDEIELTVISDGKDRKSRPAQGVVDNFDDYVAYRVELDNFLARLGGWTQSPKVRVIQIQTVTSASSDLLQLTDLLLGATQAALVGASSRPVKRELASMVVSWYRDLKKLPREQEYKMHRKFNLWGFPDESGKPFNYFQMALSQCDEQLSLFSG